MDHGMNNNVVCLLVCEPLLFSYRGKNIVDHFSSLRVEFVSLLIIFSAT